MPVLEAVHKLAPKSVLRHRPIGDGSEARTPVVSRASRPQITDDNGEEDTQKRKPEQTDKQQAQGQAGKRKARRGVLKKLPRTRKPAEARQFMFFQAYPLLYLFLGMVVMLLLWMILSAAYGWFTMWHDDLLYGRLRTFQADAWVGHNEQTGSPSHFIAMNLHSHIEIIEIAGSDPSHTHIYNGPQLYGTDSDLAPVTLNFVDVNSDHKPDMIVTFQGSRLIFINTGDTFRPMFPSERSQVEQALQHLRL